MVCTPAPPSSQPWFAGADCSTGREVGRASGVGVARGFWVFLEGVGSGLRDALGLGVGVGDGLWDAEGRAEAAKSFGADCATGAVGLVDPTTKWTVMMTAVTLAAVHDSQMSR
ncbi:hypothetical protein [Streptomyces sp. NBC_00829]|uniref:hypothetical protein n=1 Tax=Streptomyces sp. NBC_00829 TaxID=2903679 RepID=UPI00386ED5F8|nr:hypothetical protein OG293_06425 [Streptomyces sp. NBC_00829]